MPTAANPFIDSAEIEDARRDMTDLAFHQEYLAQFVSWEGAVFRKILDAVWAVPEELTRWQRSGIFDIWTPTFAIGCDWGRTNDYTVFTVMTDLPLLWSDAEFTAQDKASSTVPAIATKPAGVVHIERMRGVEYATQRLRLRALWERFGRPVVLAEANSIGGPILEELRREGMHVRGFQTTNATKAKIIDAVALALEQETLKIPNDPVLIGELQAFEAKTLPSGLIQYSAPDGGHDDMVISLGLGYHALRHFAGAYSHDPRRQQQEREFGLRVLLGGFGSF